jgi:hypothetical protein
MKRTSNKLMLGALAVIVLASGFLALKDHLGKSASPPSGFPMGGPPGGPGQSADFQKSHRYTFQLMRLVGNIGRLDNESKTPLTPAQAKALLAILQPLRERESLDQPAAKEAVKALQAVLTDEQRAAIGAMPPEHQFRQGGPPPGPPPGSRPSGPPPNMSRKPMEDFNPLNPPAGGPPGRPGGGGMDKLFDDLQKKSGGK